MKMILIASLLAACFIPAVQAADIPEPGKLDARVRFVTYKKDDVTVVNVRRGAVTRIVLADDEKIVAAATGFTADCSKVELEWCVHADVGTNQIWIKPKDSATHNNLELKSAHSHWFSSPPPHWQPARKSRPHSCRPIRVRR